jgi:hypothetical protein
MDTHTRLLSLDRDLWVADRSLRIAAVELGARMTVMRLSSGALLLHSPVAPDAGLVEEIRALGPLAAIVAPNRFHHLYVGGWVEAFPGTPLFAAPGLDRKRPDLSLAGILTDTPDPLWAADVDQVLLAGIPLTNEVVFFHRPSRTLVATDLAFHIGPDRPAFTRLAFRLSGAYERLAPTFLERFLVRDRERFRASLRRILEWPFERVIVAHGSIVESGGRDALARGYEWILGAS